MTQEVKLGTDVIILNSEIKYSGSEKLDDNEKLVRKAVGLPVTKQLIFYKDKRTVDSVINVVSYQLVEMFDALDRWYTVEVTLSDGEKVRIHSSYLIEMQKPSFIADMAAQMA